MTGPPRVAVVTGANRGIGFEVSRQLAVGGMRVVMACRDGAAGREAAATLAARGLDVEARVLDVRDPEACERFAKEALLAHGPVAALVNNAAVAMDEGGLLDADEEAWRATLDTNLLGPWRLCRAFAPAMREAGYGRIVNVSSGAGSITDPATYAPTYSVSKAALNMLTRILALELEGTGVKVNAACPGWVRTRMGGPGAPRSPEEGADTVAWLATLPDDGPTGGFFRDRRPADW